MRFSIASILSLLLFVSAANADFMVFLSDRAPDQSPVAGALNLTGIAPGATGNLYLYGDGSSQLSGLSLDLAATGNGLKLTSATVNNPGGRWSFLDGPLTITDNLISSIGGAAIPPGAPGVGGPTADEVPGVGFLIATIGYMGLGNNPGTSNLELRVGNNLIADYEGNPAMVRLGSPTNPLVDGGVAGGAGAAGSVGFGGGGGENTPPSGVDATINGVVAGPGVIVNHQFTATDTEDPSGPFTWSNLVFNGAPGHGGSGVPLLQPTLSPTGAFAWNTNGSARGIYSATATVADPDGATDTALLTINVTGVPEPSTLALCGLAMVGFVGLLRRS